MDEANCVGTTAKQSRRELLTKGSAMAGVAVAAALHSPRPAAADPTSLLGTAVDVRQFGARGDGSTDDTDAINAAISAVGAAGGGVVFLPVTAANVYLVRTVKMADRVTVEGQVPTTTIRKQAGSAGPVITNGAADGSGGWNASFRRLTIDGNRDRCPNATDGIGQFPGGTKDGYIGDGVIIEDVRILQCARHGLNVGDSKKGVYLLTIRNLSSTYNTGRGVLLSSVFDSWFLAGWVAENGAGGLLISTCTKVRFIAVQIEGNDDQSRPLGGVRPGLETKSPGELVIDGCSFTSCRGAIRIDGSLTAVTITNCTFGVNNSHRQVGVSSNIETVGGNNVMRNIRIHDNVFLAKEPDADTVAFHVKINDPVGVNSRYTNLSIHDNAMETLPGSPAAGAILVPGRQSFNAGVRDNAGVDELNGCHLLRTGQVVPHGVDQAVAFTDVSSVDPSGLRSASPDLSAVTIAKDGLYSLVLNVQWGHSTFGDRVLRINDASGVTLASSSVTSDATGSSGGTVVTVAMLGAGQAIVAVVHQTSGDDLEISRAALSIVPTR